MSNRIQWNAMSKEDTALDYVEKNIDVIELNLFTPNHEPIRLEKFLSKNPQVLEFYLRHNASLVAVVHDEKEINQFISCLFIERISWEKRVPFINFLTKYAQCVSKENQRLVFLNFFKWMSSFSSVWFEGSVDWKNEIKEVRQAYSRLFDCFPGINDEILLNPAIELLGTRYSSSLFLVGLPEDQVEQIKKIHPKINQIPYSDLDAIVQKRWFSYSFDSDPLKCLGNLIKPLHKLLTEENFYYKNDNKMFNFALFDVVYVLNKSIPTYDQQVLVNELKKVDNATWIELNAKAYEEKTVTITRPQTVKNLASFYGLSRVIKLIINSFNLENILILDTASMLEEHRPLLLASKVLPEKPRSLKDLHDFLAKLPKKIDNTAKITQEWSQKLEGKQIDEDYSIHFLETEADFILAGVILGICVGNADYRRRVRNQSSQIFVLKNKQGETCYCVEYARAQNLGSFLDENMDYVLNNGITNGWELRQAKGMGNGNMPQLLLQKVKKIISNEISSQTRFEPTIFNMIRLIFDLIPALKPVLSGFATIGLLGLLGFVAYSISVSRSKPLIPVNNVLFDKKNIVYNSVVDASFPIAKLTATAGMKTFDNLKKTCFKIEGIHFVNNGSGYFRTITDGLERELLMWNLKLGDSLKYVFCTEGSPNDVKIEMITVDYVQIASAKYQKINN